MSLDWILIGEVVSTQGIKGEVRVIMHTDFPQRYTTMSTAHLFSSNDTTPSRVLTIVSCRFHKSFVILKFEGIDSINDAQTLKGMLIKVRQEDLVLLPSDRFYLFELIGLPVITTDGVQIGTVIDVLQQSGVNDIYVVKPMPGITKLKEILVPVIDDVVKDINIEVGQIIVNLLDGLLE